MENTETIRIAIDLPRTIAEALTAEAKDNKRVRKAHIEAVLETHGEKYIQKKEKAEAANG